MDHLALPSASMAPLPIVTLTGRHVRLEPLAFDHLPGLLAAATGPRDTYGLTWVPPDEPAMRAYVKDAASMREAGEAVPFATIDIRDPSRPRVVGSTRFATIERWSWRVGTPPHRPIGVDAAEIGWTWLAADAQRTAINTEAKLLMLGLAFDEWQLERVTLKTDARNFRSRNAIERIGGKLDGILRAHMPAYDGTVRDTAFFSILRKEWNGARAALERRLRT
jgi:RimJ/RimL family protein N-acetyltransferase